MVCLPNTAQFKCCTFTPFPILISWSWFILPVLYKTEELDTECSEACSAAGFCQCSLCRLYQKMFSVQPSLLFLLTKNIKDFNGSLSRCCSRCQTNCTSCPLGKMGADETLAAILGLGGPSYKWAYNFALHGFYVFYICTCSQFLFGSAKASFRSAKASMASQHCFSWESAASKGKDYILAKPQISSKGSKDRRRYGVPQQEKPEQVGYSQMENLTID